MGKKLFVMKKLFTIITLASLLMSCNSERKYERLANEYLQKKKIPAERVIASLPNKEYHALYFIEVAELGRMTELGDKCHNIIKYDLKTRERTTILSAKNLPQELEKGAGFITINHFGVDNDFIYITSYIDVGYYDIALYSMSYDLWLYVDSTYVNEISMSNWELTVRGTDIDFPAAECFGNLIWTKKYNITSDCIENTLYDTNLHKYYDGERLIEKEDLHYIQRMVQENCVEYLRKISVSSIALLQELEENQAACDAKYRGEPLFFYIDDIHQIGNVQDHYAYDYKYADYRYYVKGLGNLPYSIYCFSNDPAVASMRKGDACVFYGEYVSSTSQYEIHIVNCRTLDKEIMDYVFNSLYLPYIASLKGN